MRGGRGCRHCRQQHTKCVIQNGSSSCTRCVDAGRSCDFDPRFRFKQVFRIESSQATRPGVDLVFKKDQVWIDTDQPLNFVYEDGINLDQDTTASAPTQSTQPEVPQPEPAKIETSRPEEPQPVANEMFENFDLGDGTTIDSAIAPMGLSFDVHDSNTHDTPQLQRLGSWDHTRNLSSVGIGSPLSLQHSHSSLWQQMGASPSSTFSAASPHDFPTLAATYVAQPSANEEAPQMELTRREAHLLHYYIEHLAPWADTCDPERHFAREVPNLALRRPMMLYAILALSSRHEAILGDGDELESTTYQDQCLSLLIKALSAPEHTYNADLLATVVILRHYEELRTADDNHYHYFGLSRLLNTIARFSSSGGLGEAASWWSLRQVIYVSLVRHQPLEINLENFDHSAAFGLQNDSSATNVVILIFAKMLKLLYSPEGTDLAQLKILEQDLERWNLLKPNTFRSIYYREPNFSEKRPFPDICMSTVAQVVGMQYYHAAKILLLLHNPANPALAGFNATKERRRVENSIVTHLSAVLGLSISNPFVPNACFEAHHLLYTCGYCFQHPLHREHALKFLRHAEARTGWKMANTASMLQQQWGDLDAP